MVNDSRLHFIAVNLFSIFLKLFSHFSKYFNVNVGFLYRRDDATYGHFQIKEIKGEISCIEMMCGIYFVLCFNCKFFVKNTSVVSYGREVLLYIVVYFVILVFYLMLLCMVKVNLWDAI